MKFVYKILLSLTLFLSSCRKYDEGSYVFKAKDNLFSEDHYAGKTWELTGYEVNGIDCTMYIISGNKFSRYQNKYINFKQIDNQHPNYQMIDPTYKAVSECLYYFVSFKNRKKQIVFSDTTKNEYHNGAYEKNIFNPQFNKETRWEIVKLTRSELIITYKGAKAYKLNLRSN